MRKLVALVTTVTAVLAVAIPSASAEGQITSQGQVVARFAAVTGEKLSVNPKLGYRGHYVALGLGTPSIAEKARYGVFTVYVVTGPDVTTEVNGLLADSHTGRLGVPGPAAIYWEAGTTLGGQHYWLAKKRYGANIVLTWIGARDERKTDPSFTRLHRALLPFASL
jgi:hypothetical protein